MRLAVTIRYKNSSCSETIKNNINDKSCDSAYHLDSLALSLLLALSSLLLLLSLFFFVSMFITVDILL